MNREEIENRIMVCEQKVRDYLEVGNTKTAERYNNEIHKWEKLLSDLDLLNERKIYELLDYKKGYFNLEEENQRLKEENSKLKHLPKQIEQYILSEMYVNREVVAGWLQFDKLLKMIGKVDE